MLASYEDFEKQVINVLTARSRNFVNTDCDIIALSNLVYTDITNKIIFDWIKDEYLCDDTNTVTIRENNYDSSTPEITATEKYGLPTNIVDEYDYDISMSLAHVDTYNYKFVSDAYIDEFNGKNIYFIRPVQYSIEKLPSRFYDDIFSAMIEGLMYHIETAIPSQVDGQLSNLYYQRFFSEKERLLNKYPQIQYVGTNFPKRNINV